jgi:hypothetical protein
LVTPRTLGLYGGALMILAAVYSGLVLKRNGQSKGVPS